MAKTVLKELIIVLLLCLAIILILGILLYEYVPMSKTIPNEVSYTTPEDVKEELLASDVEEDQIVMTYEVTASDLSGYRSTQDYVPGKANPFSSYDTSSSTTGTSENSSSSIGESSSSSSGSTGSSSGSSSSSGSTSSSSSDNSSSTSGGRFFQDTGTK